MADDVIEMHNFLAVLIVRGGSSSRKHLPIASRAQDKVRAKAKQLGWALFKDGAWHITPAGEEAHRASRTK